MPAHPCTTQTPSTPKLTTAAALTGTILAEPFPPAETSLCSGHVCPLEEQAPVGLAKHCTHVSLHSHPGEGLFGVDQN